MAKKKQRPNLPIVTYIVEPFFETRWGMYRIENYQTVAVKALWSTHATEAEALEAKAQAERGEHYMQTAWQPPE